MGDDAEWWRFDLAMGDDLSRLAMPAGDSAIRVIVGKNNIRCGERSSSGQRRGQWARAGLGGVGGSGGDWHNNI